MLDLTPESGRGNVDLDPKDGIHVALASWFLGALTASLWLVRRRGSRPWRLRKSEVYK